MIRPYIILYLVCGVLQSCYGEDMFDTCQKEKDSTKCNGISGCSYDCTTQSCLPREYLCLTNSNKCSPLCGNETSCNSEPNCRYNDVSKTCLGPGDPEPSLLRFYTGYPEFFFDLETCIIMCRTDIISILVHKCKSPVTKRELCREPRYVRHRCCAEFSTTTTRRTTTTNPPATAPPTTEPPTTTTPTTEPPIDNTRDKDCQQFDFKHKGCRKQAKCRYSCFNDQCENKDDIRQECDEGCAIHCYDACGCKNAAGGKCEFDVITGRCEPRVSPALCHGNILQGDECGRSNYYYADAARLCLNNGDRGKCKIEKNILSVNLNGPEYTDELNITYQADSAVKFEDRYNTRIPLDLSSSKLSGADASLFQTVVTGAPKENVRIQCLRYIVPFPEVGNYQLIVRTFEPNATKPMQRLFNIYLGCLPAAGNIDVFATVGQNVPMSIVVNFEVVHDDANTNYRFIKIKGFKKKVLDELIVGFCLGDCRLDSRFTPDIGSYIVSAFAVVKLE